MDTRVADVEVPMALAEILTELLIIKPMLRATTTTMRDHGVLLLPATKLAAGLPILKTDNLRILNASFFLTTRLLMRTPKHMPVLATKMSRVERETTNATDGMRIAPTRIMMETRLDARWSRGTALLRTLVTSTGTTLEERRNGNGCRTGVFTTLITIEAVEKLPLMSTAMTT